MMALQGTYADPSFELFDGFTLVRNTSKVGISLNRLIVYWRIATILRFWQRKLMTRN